MTNTNIGKLGVWANIYADSYPEQIKLARQIEDWGYSALWLPDPLVHDPFISLAAIALHTDKLYLGTGIASIQTRAPVAMSATRQSLGSLCNGRLILGLGVSHSEVIADMLHMDYRKPMTTMSNYLDAMKSVNVFDPEGSATAAASEKQYGIVVLAALGDKMLELASNKADGAHPYLVTPEHSARARAVMGPDSWLAPEQKVILCKDASSARRAARQHLAIYLSLQNYRNSLLKLDFTESDFEHGGSDRLVDALITWGDETTILKHLERHWHNGADHVCIQPLRPDGQPGYDYQAIEAFAPGSG